MTDNMETALRHLMQNETRQAKLLFERELALSPDHREAQAGLAICLALENKIAAASELALKVQSPLPPPALAFLAQGMISDAQGNVAQADLDFRKALEINPTSSYARYLYGIFLSKSGQIDDGIALLRGVVDEHPESWMARRNLAISYDNKGEHKMAFQESLKTTRMNPSASNARLLVIVATEAYSFARWIPALLTFIFLVFFGKSVWAFAVLMSAWSLLLILLYWATRHKRPLVLLLAVWSLGAIYYIVYFGR